MLTPSKIDRSNAILSNGKLFFFQTHDTFVPTLHLAAQCPRPPHDTQTRPG